ncbi:MAG: DUF4838 domain-containing protein [Clostridiaceae bacterium]|jgi:hypothetical protein|nr:DUF4838 domain-containing protein [Clostridiaceae bacterium]
MPHPKIAKANTAVMTIVLSQQVGPQENNAAKELLYYLERITGACFEIEKAASAAAMPKPAIALGEAALWLGLDEPRGLGEDGFVIRTLGDSLALYGGRRGILYAAYELLEQLGCRFFTPLCEKVPTCENLALPELDCRQVPALEYRYHNYKDFTAHPSFAVKRRINGPVPIDEDWGGHLAYAWFVHTFERNILDPAEVFDAHPEYFSLVDGKRLRERTQLCLTNPDVLRITIEKVKKALAENPQCRLISVSQNDWNNNCTCDSCRKIDAEEGSSAGSLIWFVNQVAEAVEKDFPDAVIDTLAYQYSRPAPRQIRPRHNVCVRLCSIESCFMHPFETCDDDARAVKRPDGTSSRFITDLQDWAKVCNRLYIWDYTTCFAHYPMPFPNWNVLQPNMQAFVRNNVKGVFEQACGAAGGSTDLNELRAYLLAKLLWDPDCDLEAHMQDFLNAFYGAAGPEIRRYIRLLTDTVEQENIHVGFNDSCDRPYLTPERLDQYDAIFDRAAEQVQGDPIRLPRVEKARLSLRWVRIKNRAMLEGRCDTAEINTFFADWKAHGLTRIDEWVSEQTTHKALLRPVWRGTDFLQNWWEEGKERH